MSAKLWDRRYAAVPGLYGEAPNDFLQAQARLLKPHSRVLCVGDGEGRNGVHLAELGHDVVALDVSEVALTHARELAERRGVHLETWHVDLAHYIELGDPPKPWDAVVCIFVHLPMPLRRAVARELTRQTAPGGRLLLEAYTPAQLALGTGGPKDPSLLVTRADVVDDWGDGWQLDVRLVERHVREGSGHTGLASVVQAIGLRLA